MCHFVVTLQSVFCRSVPASLGAAEISKLFFLLCIYSGHCWANRTAWNLCTSQSQHSDPGAAPGEAGNHDLVSFTQWDWWPWLLSSYPSIGDLVCMGISSLHPGQLLILWWPAWFAGVFSAQPVWSEHVFFFYSTLCSSAHLQGPTIAKDIYSKWEVESWGCEVLEEEGKEICPERERRIPFTLYQCVYHLSFLCLSEDYIQIAQIKAERDKKWKKDKQRHSELFFSRELRELGTIVHLQLSEQVAWLEVWARSPSVKMDTRADLARNCSLSQAQEITGEHWLSTANEGISWKRAAAWGSQVDLVILDVSTPSQSLQKH